MTAEPFLQVLGSGDSESMRFWNSNLLVQNNGKRLLLDCGSTIKYALADQKMGLQDIDAVYISHVHGDHCFGLERLGFESRYIYHTRPTLYATKGVLDVLWHQTLVGSMGHSAEGPNSLESFFDVIEIEQQFEWQGLNFELFPTTHTKNKECHGLHINGQVTWTADSNVIPDLADQACKTVLHDLCTTDFHPAHATFSEALAGYSSEFLRTIWAIHYPDDIDKHRAHFCQHLAGIAEQGQTFCLT